MQSFYVYILICADGSYYVGSTDCFDKRMAEHSLGMCHYTRERLPIEVVFVQEMPSRDEALNRERQLKGWTRAKKDALIRSNWVRLKGLAVPIRTHAMKPTG